MVALEGVKVDSGQISSDEAPKPLLLILSHQLDRDFRDELLNIKQMKTQTFFKTAIKWTSLVGLVFIVNTLQAQEHKWAISLESHLGKSDVRLIERTGNTDTLLQPVTFANILDYQSRWAYDLGLFAERNIGSHFAIRLGVRYAKWGFETDGQELIFASQLENNMDPILDDGLPIASRSFYKHTYLEIPIQFKLYIPVGTNRLYWLGGLNPSISLSNKETFALEYVDKVEEISTNSLPRNGLRSLNLVAELGFGWEQKLGDRFAFYVEPNLRVQTMGIANNVPINRILFFYGLGTGITMKI